jgi:ATPase subunit of ABC transporter with duplicated ATPase domains
MSPSLYSISRRGGPQIIISLGEQDEIPRWITHVIYLGPGCTIRWIGTKEYVIDQALQAGAPVNLKGQQPTKWRKFLDETDDNLDDIENSNKLDADEESHSDSNDKKANFVNESRWDLQYDVIPSDHIGESLISMEGIKLSYGDRPILGHFKQDVDGESKEGFWWNLRRGERWGIFGPNGKLFYH